MDYKNFSEILTCISQCECNLSIIVSKLEQFNFTALQSDLFLKRFNDLDCKLESVYEVFGERSGLSEKNEVVKEKK